MKTWQRSNQWEKFKELNTPENYERVQEQARALADAMKDAMNDTYDGLSMRSRTIHMEKFNAAKIAFVQLMEDNPWFVTEAKRRTGLSRFITPSKRSANVK